MATFRVLISRQTIEHTVVLLKADDEDDARARATKTLVEGELERRDATFVWEQDDYAWGVETIDLSDVELPAGWCCKHPDWVACECIHHDGRAVMVTAIDGEPVR